MTSGGLKPYFDDHEKFFEKKNDFSLPCPLRKHRSYKGGAASVVLQIFLLSWKLRSAKVNNELLENRTRILVFGWISAKISLVLSTWRRRTFTNVWKKRRNGTEAETTIRFDFEQLYLHLNVNLICFFIREKDKETVNAAYLIQPVVQIFFAFPLKTWPANFCVRN